MLLQQSRDRLYHSEQFRPWRSQRQLIWQKPFGMLPYNVVDHVARATCNGAEDWSLFEPANMSRHDPSGFTGWTDMAE